MKRPVITFVVATSLLATGSIGASGALAQASAPVTTQNIVQVAASNPDFSTLVKLVGDAGLADTLSTGNYTVFAPTNAAFAKLPPAVLARVGSDPALLKTVLLSHVVQGTVPAKTVVTLKSATTLSGQVVKIRTAGKKVFLNGNIRVIATDVAASNGVIHVIDSVILPKPKRTIVEVLQRNRQFSTLTSLVVKAGLADTLSTGNYTVFAPTNRAFARLPKATLDKVANDPELLKSVLLYHVVNGKVTAAKAVRAGSATTLNGKDVTIRRFRGFVRVNDARVIHPNAMVKNGVIHVIDRVLVP